MTKPPSSKLHQLAIVGYGLSDLGLMALLQFAIIYLLFFYTEFVGVSAAFAGTLFLVSRIWDAINDPLMGLVVDNTKTRYGKCRPYLIVCSALFGLSSLALFWAPDLQGWQLALYVVITYNLFNMAFTATSIPYTALLALMSNDQHERVKLSSSRAFFEALSLASVPLLSEWLISLAGGRNSETAYLVTVMVLGVACVVTCALTFFSARELASETNHKQVTLKSILRVTQGNWPWLIVVLINALVNISITMRTSSAIYYFQYVVGDMRHFGLFMTLGFVALFPFAMIAPALSKRYGKRSVTLAGCLLALLGHGLIILFPTALPALLIGSVLGGCAMGGLVSVLFAMIGDVVDDVSRRKGLRAEGIVTSAISLGYKVGLGFGAAAVGWILSLGGYAAGSTLQSSAAMMAISVAFVWLPALVLIICLPVIYLYRLDQITLAANVQPAAA